MRYLIFAGESYYAHGGGNDFRDATDDFSEAKRMAQEWSVRVIDEPDLDRQSLDWGHVFDTELMQVVWRTWVTPYGDDTGR